MNLGRINLEFHAEEDRLMARVLFDKTSEIHFWLTQRLVRHIRPALLQMAQAGPDIHLQPGPEARKAPPGFQHERRCTSSSSPRRRRIPAASTRSEARQCR